MFSSHSVVGGDEPVPGHPSLKVLAVELAAEVPVSKRGHSPLGPKRCLSKCPLILVRAGGGRAMRAMITVPCKGQVREALLRLL